MVHKQSSPSDSHSFTPVNVNVLVVPTDKFPSGLVVAVSIGLSAKERHVDKELA